MPADETMRLIWTRQYVVRAATSMMESDAGTTPGSSWQTSVVRPVTRRVQSQSSRLRASSSAWRARHPAQRQSRCGLQPATAGDDAQYDPPETTWSDDPIVGWEPSTT
jgi:hypothetical protein